MLKNFVEFFFGFQRRLGHIIRFNTRPKTIDETVAAHSYYVGLYSLILAEYLEKKGVKINKEQTMRRALLHDLEECVAGDVMTHVKDDEEINRIYNKLAIFSVETTFEKLPEYIRKFLMSEWHEFNNESSIEDWLVEVADDLSGVIYCKEQCNVGNKYFDIILQNYMYRLKKLVKGSELEDLYYAIEKNINNTNETKLDMHYNEDIDK